MFLAQESGGAGNEWVGSCCVNVKLVKRWCFWLSVSMSMGDDDFRSLAKATLRHCRSTGGPRPSGAFGRCLRSRRCPDIDSLNNIPCCLLLERAYFMRPSRDKRLSNTSAFLSLDRLLRFVLPGHTAHHGGPEGNYRGPIRLLIKRQDNPRQVAPGHLSEYLHTA